MTYSPQAIAKAVCEVMEAGKERATQPSAIFAGQRGAARTAELRAVTMFLWRLWSADNPTLTQTGFVFGRDRRNVQRGLARITQAKIPNREQVSLIKARLDGQST